MTNTRIRYIGMTLLAFGLCFAHTLQAQDLIKRALDQTIDEAAQEAAKSLKDTRFEDVNTIAVLPFWGDCAEETKQYIARTIQDRIIGGKYRVMERSDAAWDKLLSEIKWSELREDIMNQATLQQFGRIVGCDAVVYGRRARRRNGSTQAVGNRLYKTRARGCETDSLLKRRPGPTALEQYAAMCLPGESLTEIPLLLSSQRPGLGDFADYRVGLALSASSRYVVRL